MRRRTRRMRRRTRMRTRRRRRGGFENSYVTLHCRTQHLSSLHYLATYQTDHGVRFSPKSKLRVGITSLYLTGILITCMTATYILL